MNTSHSVISDYYRYGIELGLIDFSEAVEWANQIIASETNPCGELVDLALSRTQGKFGVIDALKEIPGERNPQQSGGYLLGLLRFKLTSIENAVWVSKMALMVAGLTQLPEEIRYKFDWIDDELNLAIRGTYGTVEECFDELKNVLSTYQKI